MRTSTKYAARFVTAACALAILLCAQALPVSGSVAQGASAKSPPPLTDISARRKHRVPRTSVAAPAPRPVWTGADPTKGPGIETVREMQRSGRCIFDEGYGRWTACSNM